MFMCQSNNVRHVRVNVLYSTSFKLVPTHGLVFVCVFIKRELEVEKK